jgi:hypothetical protein
MPTSARGPGGRDARDARQAAARHSTILIAAATNRAEARTAAGTETTKCTNNPERETRHTPKSNGN